QGRVDLGRLIEGGPKPASTIGRRGAGGDGIGVGGDGSRLVDDRFGDWAAGKIAADYELAVVGFFHAAVFPDDHAGDRVAPLNVRDVEAFDRARLFEKVERVLDGFADHFRGGLEDAEALFESVLGVVRNQ